MSTFKDPEIQEIDDYLSRNADASLTYFDEKLEEHPDNVYILSMKAISLIDNFQSARSVIAKIKKQKDSDYASYGLLANGKLKFFKNQLPEAIQLYKKALDLDKNNKWAHYYLYECYKSIDSSFHSEEIMEQGELNTELEVYSDHLYNILQTDPNFYLALLEIVSELSEDQEYLKIKELLEKADSDIIKDELAYYLGESYYKTRNYLEAHHILIDNIKDNPRWKSFTMLGYLDKHVKDIVADENRIDAEECFKYAHDMDELQLEPLYGLGELYIEKKKYEDAVDIYTMLVDEYGDDECNFEIALLKLNLQESASVEQELNRFGSLDPYFQRQSDLLKKIYKDHTSYNKNQLLEFGEKLEKISSSAQYELISSLLTRIVANRTDYIIDDLLNED